VGEELLKLGRREFLKELGDLERQYKVTSDNPGSYRCEGCEHCAECMFCKDCSLCYRCTYCTACTRSTNCTHCSECEDCHRSSYCIQSKGCTGSSYVLLSSNCSDCTFCFGCVGLVRKDFHVLNQKLDRKTYFAVVAKLKKEMGIKAR